MADKSAIPLWESNSGWQLRRLPVAASAIVLVIMGLLVAPSISAWFWDFHRAGVLNHYATLVEQTPKSVRDALLTQAAACNGAMESVAYIVPGLAVPQSTDEDRVESEPDYTLPQQWVDVEEGACSEVLDDDGLANRGSFRTLYDSTLNLGDGVQARLTVPKSGTDVAVYPWVTRASLNAGVGHVPSSSLPVGGDGSHAVIAGNGGTQFSDLRQVEPGDRFTLQVLGETLAYQVDEVKLVSATETLPLTAVEGEDRVSLVTSPGSDMVAEHLVVSGHRVEASAQELADLAKPSRDPGFPMWAVTIVATFGILGYLIWRAGRPQEDEELGTETSQTQRTAEVDEGDSGDKVAGKPAKHGSNRETPRALRLRRFEEAQRRNREAQGVSGALHGGAEREPGTASRVQSGRDNRIPADMSNDPAFQEYLRDYQPDPRAELEMLDEDDQNSSYRNVQNKEESVDDDL